MSVGEILALILGLILIYCICKYRKSIFRISVYADLLLILFLYKICICIELQSTSYLICINKGSILTFNNTSYFVDLTKFDFEINFVLHLDSFDTLDLDFLLEFSLKEASKKRLFFVLKKTSTIHLFIELKKKTN